MSRQIHRRFSIVTALLAVILGATLPSAAAAATLEVTGPAGASLVINGRALGFFPLDGPLDLPPGTYTITSELRGHIDYENILVLPDDDAWQRLTVRLVPLSRRTAWSSNLLLAGLGQHYLGHHTRGWVYNAAEAGGLLVALLAELDRSNLRKDYLDIQDMYDSSINAQDILRFREEALQTYSDMKDKEDTRNLALLVAGGAIVASVVDALVSFPAVEAGAGTVPVDPTDLGTGPGARPDPLTAVHVAVRLEF